MKTYDVIQTTNNQDIFSAFLDYREAYAGSLPLKNLIFCMFRKTTWFNKVVDDFKIKIDDFVIDCSDLDYWLSDKELMNLIRGKIESTTGLKHAYPEITTK